MHSNLTPFNTPIETGVRALILLDALFPLAVDIQRLVDFDYLIVHSGDAGGPKSLHAPLPFRTGELLVRRRIIENGLLLMISRNLIQRVVTSTGILYRVTDTANPFLSALNSNYIMKLKERATWITDRFGGATDEEIKKITRHFFEEWTTQFQPIELTLGGNHDLETS
jgi:hypothetical protein